eukprot:CAMPEP_0172152622 /NCGR_PEP_ID=MMETSP1050-20130122/954_1 /TAXON_ID=233186 /ORGANISM="Cryptomonas curvata, Strain CCAP979/52" /LENGTH=126 /DNA_ID=CAMNT_0012820993 /DNA_START=161 /DNA_END=542 /DNA_ORIENTATION=-
MSLSDSEASMPQDASGNCGGGREMVWGGDGGGREMVGERDAERQQSIQQQASSNQSKAMHGTPPGDVRPRPLAAEASPRDVDAQLQHGSRDADGPVMAHWMTRGTAQRTGSNRVGEAVKLAVCSRI